MPTAIYQLTKVYRFISFSIYEQLEQNQWNSNIIEYSYICTF